MKNNIRLYGVYFIVGLLWYLFLFLSVKIDYAEIFNISKSLYTILIIIIGLVISTWAAINMFTQYKRNNLHPLVIGLLLIAGGLCGLLFAKLILYIA